MHSRWNDADAARHAARAADPVLGERVYASRLLGSERSLVLHGGGNTSVKRGGVLYVKGSGSDLAQIREEDFAAIDLQRAIALRDAGHLDNPAVRAAVAAAAVRPGPGASIETLMHALLPWPFIEHTHADAILAITDTVNGERIAAQLFGEMAPLVPFRPSGFDLALACEAAYRQQASARTIGLILLHHGVVAFGHSARESYENMLALVTRAEDHLRAAGAWELPADAHPFTWQECAIAALRARLCRVAGAPLLLALQEGGQWQAFARRPDVAALCTEGPATPQHAVFLRAQALAGTDVEAFARDYGTQVRAACPVLERDHPGFDFAPRVLVDAQLGVWVAARHPAHLRMAQDILQQDLEIKVRACLHDRYAGLPVTENIEAELHYGGFLRQADAAQDASTRLLGQVMLVAAANDADALRQRYQQAGAAVACAGPQTGHAAQARACVREAVRCFGGLDLLVTDAAGLALLEAAAPVLRYSPVGGGRVALAQPSAPGTEALRRRCAALGLRMVETAEEAA